MTSSWYRNYYIYEILDFLKHALAELPMRKACYNVYNIYQLSEEKIDPQLRVTRGR